MTVFEWTYLHAESFLPMTNGEVRRRLLALGKSIGREIEILDVGGRRSPCTIGDLERRPDIAGRYNTGVSGLSELQIYLQSGPIVSMHGISIC